MKCFGAYAKPNTIVISRRTLLKRYVNLFINATKHVSVLIVLNRHQRVRVPPVSERWHVHGPRQRLHVRMRSWIYRNNL